MLPDGIRVRAIFLDFQSNVIDFLVSLDVQVFAVWEKDAKDHTGFVGYCYLDLFPRGAPAPIQNRTFHSYPLMLQNPNTLMLPCGL